MTTRTNLLPLGRLLATPGAIEALALTNTNPLALLRRHATGDWGDLCAEDIEANRLAIAMGARVLSAYDLAEGVRIWILTEADRTVTTLLLPENY